MNNKIELPDNNILIEFMVIANLFFNGHFQINKFTSNYRACFGTPYGKGDVQFSEIMFSGETMTEAMKKAIEFFVVCCKCETKKYHEFENKLRN